MISKATIVLASFILILAVALLFSWRSDSGLPEPVSHQSPQPTGQQSPEAMASPGPIAHQSPDLIRQDANASAVLPIGQDKHKPPDAYPQLSVRGLTVDAATDAYIENIRRDPAYQWKVPISLFGKVVDQDKNPVAGAAVHFQWVNLQGPEGVEGADTISDAAGRFSLEGKRGKNLGVTITKEGYYAASPYDNQLSFEYANPAEHTFYEPDPSNPVIFVIRKQGRVEELIVKEVKLDLHGQGATKTVDFLTGGVSPTGQLHITVWKPTITIEQINTGRAFPYDWRVRIRISDGGLAEHADVFPFEAPESGYVAQYDASLHATSGAGPDVTVDKHFYFYFGQPRKYGRMRFRTDGHRSRIAIEYWLNPSGSRNLEYDVSKDES